MKLSSDRQWWSPAQVAAEFGIGRSTVYDLISQGAFGVPLKFSERPGGGLRVHRQNIVRLIAQRTSLMAEELGLVE